ncbi:MAG: orotidine-5'-phosphate decarboxylase [Beijerinckiaceae bacterium]
MTDSGDSFLAARDRVIVALDVPTIAEAEALVDTLGDAASFYKIGMELAYIGGIPFGERLIRAGKKVFFDLKLHDIPNTVERATAQIAGTGAHFMTVHAYPQTLAAAAFGAQGSTLGILGVSVLTSMSEDDAARAGYGMGVADLVRRRARQAQENHAAGLVCSPLEIAAVRETVGHALKIVTPGVRPAGAALGDQKRVMTPGEAIRAGADHLVVGRPITQAADPAEAARAIIAEVAQALQA